MSFDALHWLALALIAAAMTGAFGAIFARSLIAACLYLVATGTAISAALMLLGAHEGALALALVAAAWAPVLLLAAMLLSARAAKSSRAGWLAALAGVAVTGLIWWPLAELETPARAAIASGAQSFWIAPLLLVAGVACFGLLGFGERGVARESER
jgi:hypothetical protein